MTTEALSPIVSELSVQSLQSQQSLPLLVQPTDHNDFILHWPEIKKRVDKNLQTIGGILFRGFALPEEADFYRFVKQFGFELLTYEFGSTPRTDLGKGVYTSTEYPAHQTIPLHNEQAYTTQWPMKIWFHCVTPSDTGGQTPIADSRRIYQKIDKAIRQRFEQRKLRYVRNYGNGLDLDWQKAFNTQDKQQVESYCRQQDIQFEWKPDGELRTYQICQATAIHPITQEPVWFNQAHLFHISNLETHVRETLLSIVSIADLPRNVYYGDGSEIETTILDEIRHVIHEESVYFDWQRGDVLMLDNMLVAHGRAPYEGNRKVIVAMAEPYTN